MQLVYVCSSHLLAYLNKPAKLKIIKMLNYHLTMSVGCLQEIDYEKQKNVVQRNLRNSSLINYVYLLLNCPNSVLFITLILYFILHSILKKDKRVRKV